MRPVFYFVAIPFAVFVFAVAQAETSSSASQERRTEGASDTSRVPPVIPGGTVYDAEGRRMRTITTAGPVPVNPVPQAPSPGGTSNAAAGNYANRPIEVIVDSRGQRPVLGGNPATSQQPPEAQP